MFFGSTEFHLLSLRIRLAFDEQLFISEIFYVNKNLVDLAMSVCPFLCEQVPQFQSYRDETFRKVLFLLVVYKSGRAGLDNYILLTPCNVIKKYFSKYVKNILTCTHSFIHLTDQNLEYNFKKSDDFIT